MRTGEQFGDDIEKGIDYLSPRRQQHGAPQGNFYYGNYYATQAMFMYGGDAWENVLADDPEKLWLAKQHAQGSWSGENRADAYCHRPCPLIMLQMPNRLLPILEK